MSESALPELLQQGPLRPVPEVAEERLGERSSHQTYWRWHRHGVNGAKLLTVSVLGQRMTTAAAFDAFLVERSKPPKAKAPEANDAELKAAGLL